MTQDQITPEQLAGILTQDDTEFRAFVERFDPKCWARYDLSALHLGWHFGRAESLTEDYLTLRTELEAAKFCDHHCTWAEHHPDCVVYKMDRLLEILYDDRFAQSKDWRDSGLVGRAQWLAEMYESAKSELDYLHKQADKFEDGIDWIQRAMQAEAELAKWQAVEHHQKTMEAIRGRLAS